MPPNYFTHHYHYFFRLIGPTLIHPFEYQSVFLPLLPLTLMDYFEAPGLFLSFPLYSHHPSLSFSFFIPFLVVPYLLGFMDEIPAEMKETMEDVLFLDTDKNEFSGELFL